MNNTILLKSKIMIDFFNGKTRISIDDIDPIFNMEDIGEISDEEQDIVNEDLVNILRLANKKIEVMYLPDKKKLIKTAFKEAYTDCIYFDDSDKLYGTLYDNYLDLSKETLFDNMYLEYDEFFTERDLLDYIKIELRVEGKLENTVGISDAVYFDKYMPNDLMLRIKLQNKNDLDVFLKLNRAKKECVIDIEDLIELESQKVEIDYPITICINDMTGLSAGELIRLQTKYDIKDIEILNTTNCLDREDLETEIYDVDTYLKMRKKIDQLMYGITDNTKEIDKFTKIYYRLARMASYDHDDALFIESEGAEGKENKNAHKLEGGLLDELAVCAGFSKILIQTLKCAKMEALYIRGKKEHSNVGHAWNQIRIDGIWYNTDITWDRPYICDGRNPQFCLQSDFEFCHDEYDINTYKYKTNESYDQVKLYKTVFADRKYEYEQEANEEQTDIIEYKESFFKRLISRFRQKFRKEEEEPIYKSDISEYSLKEWIRADIKYIPTSEGKEKIKKEEKER